MVDNIWKTFYIGTTMQPNRFKARLLARQQQLGIWSMLASSNVVEVLTQSDFDWILIDTEHAANEVPMVQEQLRAAAQSTVAAVVRPGTNDTVQIKRLLDIGAQTLLEIGRASCRERV